MPIYNSEAAKIQRQRALAESLRATGNEALPASIQTGGRFDAPVSGWAHANKALATMLGAYTNRQADKQQEKLNQEDQAVLASVLEAQRASQHPEESMSEVVPMQSPADRVKAFEPERQQMLQAAILKGQQFGGSAAPFADEMAKRELFPAEQSPYTLGAGDVRFDKANAPVAMGVPQRPAATPSRQFMEIIDPKMPGGHRMIEESEYEPGMQRYYQPRAASTHDGGAAGPAETMDEMSLENAALDVMRDPQALRQYAVGNSDKARGDRVKINNRIAGKMKELGITNNQLAKFRSDVQGQLKSRKGLIEMQNAVESFEVLARGNGDRLLELVGSVNVTGIPVLEGVARSLKASLGDADAAEFQSVLKTYQTEVARIISQPRLVGQLTDSQIDEMKKVASGAASPEQLVRVVKRLNFEMDLRSKGIEQSLAKAGGALDIPGTAPATPPSEDPADADDFSGLWNQEQ